MNQCGKKTPPSAWSRFPMRAYARRGAKVPTAEKTMEKLRPGKCSPDVVVRYFTNELLIY